MVESADSIANTAGVQVDDPSSNPTAGGQAKRVILRLQVDDFSGKDPSEYNDAIKAYLTFAGREPAECEKQIHFAHIEPFQDPELGQTRFHITLDIEQDLVENPDFRKLPHEIYRVLRDSEGELYSQVKPIKKPLERENFIRKIRQNTDILYPWGKTKQAYTSAH